MRQPLGHGRCLTAVCVLKDHVETQVKVIQVIQNGAVTPPPLSQGIRQVGGWV